MSSSYEAELTRLHQKLLSELPKCQVSECETAHRRGEQATIALYVCPVEYEDRVYVCEAHKSWGEPDTHPVAWAETVRQIAALLATRPG